MKTMEPSKRRLVGWTLLLLVVLCVPAQAGGQAGKAPTPPPTGLRLANAPSGVLLRWHPPEAAQTRITGYEIFRATLSSGPFVSIAKVDAGVHEFVDPTAAVETISYYKVRAMGPAGPSSFSNTATVERVGAPGH